jgi:hypothetical protein
MRERLRDGVIMAGLHGLFVVGAGAIGAGERITRWSGLLAGVLY